MDYSNSLAAKFMAALGAPGGDEGVRSLLGRVDLFIVDSKSSYREEYRRMSTGMGTRKECRRMAEELLAVMTGVWKPERS